MMRPCCYCNIVMVEVDHPKSSPTCPSCARAELEKALAEIELSDREVIEAGKRTGLHSLSGFRKHKAEYREDRAKRRAA